MNPLNKPTKPQEIFCRNLRSDQIPPSPSAHQPPGKQEVIAWTGLAPSNVSGTSHRSRARGSFASNTRTHPSRHAVASRTPQRAGANARSRTTSPAEAHRGTHDCPPPWFRPGGALPAVVHQGRDVRPFAAWIQLGLPGHPRLLPHVPPGARS